MERYIKFHLANFSYIDEINAHNKYLENARCLQETISVIQNKIAHCEKNIENLCAIASIGIADKTRALSIYVRDNQIFIGFIDSKENRVSFIDNEKYLQNNIIKDCFARLERNVLNAIDRHERSLEPALINKQITEKWHEAIPLLEKVQQTDKELKHLPEKDQDRIHHSLQYDDYINELTEQYENLDYFEFLTATRDTKNPFISKIQNLEGLRKLELELELEL